MNFLYDSSEMTLFSFYIDLVVLFFYNDLTKHS